MQTDECAKQTIAAAKEKPGGLKNAGLLAWTETEKKWRSSRPTLAHGSGKKKNPTTVESYWAKHPIISTPIFSHITTSNRFQLLVRFWHCNDNCKEPPRNDPQRDRLYKLRPLLPHLTLQFHSVYKPVFRPGRYLFDFFFI